MLILPCRRWKIFCRNYNKVHSKYSTCIVISFNHLIKFVWEKSAHSLPLKTTCSLTPPLRECWSFFKLCVFLSLYYVLVCHRSVTVDFIAYQKCTLVEGLLKIQYLCYIMVHLSGYTIQSRSLFCTSVIPWCICSIIQYTFFVLLFYGKIHVLDRTDRRRISCFDTYTWYLCIYF